MKKWGFSEVITLLQLARQKKRKFGPIKALNIYDNLQQIAIFLQTDKQWHQSISTIVKANESLLILAFPLYSANTFTHPTHIAGLFTFEFAVD